MSALSKDPVDTHIGSRLRMLRDRRGATLQDAGQAVDLTYQQIRKYELGENRLSASTLYRLAAFFDVEPSFFFEGLAPVRTAARPDSQGTNDAELQAVLDRIENEEVRHHLASLIRILEARRQG
ncbi:helix-turn-helix domain-containing protein [Aureimonas psammosilenae]|uniref:helix-turn-helix domain-containing protein n=1 Tax=Aureimonas psammosilenae TaxID=2495496 RepID=UPI001869F91D|nr:helix-turn-helix transcriptional regulator [Aureimonas psammosilenae]